MTEINPEISFLSSLFLVFKKAKQRPHSSSPVSTAGLTSEEAPCDSLGGHVKAPLQSSL